MPEQGSNSPVLILGQGLAGSCLALELLNRNIPIRVVDVPWLSASSRVAAGIINPLIFRYYTLSWRAEHYFEYSKNYFRRFGEHTKNAILHELPMLRVFGQNEVELWKKRADVQPFIRYLRKQIMGNVNGLNLEYGAGEVHASGWIDTARFLTVVRQILSEKQLIDEQQWDYRQIEASASRVYFDGKEFQAAVFCEGYHAVNNPYLSGIPFRPVKGDILIVRIPGLSVDYIVNSKIFLVPLGNDEFRLGSTYIWNFVDEKPEKHGMEMLLNDLSKIVSTRIEVLQHVAGIRPAMADRRPVVGQIPGYENLFVFNGLGSRGGLLAPPLANYLASLLTGMIAQDAETDPARFKRSHY